MPTGIRFPVDLPLPLREGYALSFEDTRSSAQPESGTARVRRNVRTEPRIEKLVWSFSQAQYNTFEVWWQETIESGAKEFDILLTDLVHSTVWFTARWLGEFESQMESEFYRWRVSGTLRLLGNSFADRPSGTDELKGKALVGITATGNLEVQKLMFGSATLGITATGRLSGAGGFLTAFVGITGTGRIPLGPLRGTSALSITANASFGIDQRQIQRVWAGFQAFKGGRSYDIHENLEAIQRNAMGIGTYGLY